MIMSVNFPAGFVWDRSSIQVLFHAAKLRSWTYYSPDMNTQIGRRMHQNEHFESQKMKIFCAWRRLKKQNKWCTASGHRVAFANQRNARRVALSSSQNFWLAWFAFQLPCPL